VSLSTTYWRNSGADELEEKAKIAQDRIVPADRMARLQIVAHTEQRQRQRRPRDPAHMRHAAGQHREAGQRERDADVKRGKA
jgi:hypothetical protein